VFANNQVVLRVLKLLTQIHQKVNAYIFTFLAKLNQFLLLRCKNFDFSFLTNALTIAWMNEL